MVASLAVLILGSALAALPAEPANAAIGAPIERGGLAYYTLVGYPEVRIGFREGMRGYEIGGELDFDITLTSLSASATGRREMWRRANLGLSLDAQLGLFGSFGARYADDRNRAGFGGRLQLGTTLSRRFSWPIVLSGTARLPLEVPFTASGLLRFGLIVGAGVEIPVGKNFFVSLNGAFGPMLWHQRSGESSFKLAIEALAGVGYRLF